MAEQSNSIPLAIQVVTSFVAKNHIRAQDVPSFITSVHEAVAKLQAPEAAAQAAPESGSEFTPAISVRKSLASPDAIVSMIDGKAYKTLKRHLSRHGLTPDQYRERYGLKADYPMVAPNYSAARQAMGKALGLGRKAVQKVEEAIGIEAVAANKPKRGRKPKALKAAISEAREHLQS